MGDGTYLPEGVGRNFRIKKRDPETGLSDIIFTIHTPHVLYFFPIEFF